MLQELYIVYNSLQCWPQSSFPDGIQAAPWPFKTEILHQRLTQKAAQSLHVTQFLFNAFKKTAKHNWAPSGGLSLYTPIKSLPMEANTMNKKLKRFCSGETLIEKVRGDLRSNFKAVLAAARLSTWQHGFGNTMHLPAHVSVGLTEMSAIHEVFTSHLTVVIAFPNLNHIVLFIRRATVNSRVTLKSLVEQWRKMSARLI